MHTLLHLVQCSCSRLGKFTHPMASSLFYCIESGEEKTAFKTVYISQARGLERNSIGKYTELVSLRVG